MRRKDVKSSDIRSIGYDESLQILEVEFKRGSVYQYVNVPKHVYAALMKAPSVGSYFNTQIRDRFQSSQVAE
ncbi:MAG: KTSC domain-containing protein [Candidatus Harrisonbacteria bacterium CG10_big_fil_rev_8_21_14_0_10_49_15]|uniref:KTSC domain-containing protein n=1 Tax=Candidatus Harrisonbacteria bacterium CG10_big_fil_rev_8_21_14_0_10_49_15 TaxID=1974587 RepID=A0A2H0UKN4_9BACT|nr:MAG: KTSC domain-containing protein [Candidatus Harrisonbacteria bacterium CG10_big_fil_rev_8_21_14_0_10_49_15]